MLFKAFALVIVTKKSFALVLLRVLPSTVVKTKKFCTFPSLFFVSGVLRRDSNLSNCTAELSPPVGSPVAACRAGEGELWPWWLP